MLGERPLLLPLSGLGAGLVLSDFCGLTLSLPAVMAGLSCLLLAYFIRSDLPTAFCTFTFFLIWGFHALSPWKNPPVSPIAIQHYAEQSVTVEGIVGLRPVVTPTGSNFILRSEAIIKNNKVIPAEGNLLVYIYSPGDLPFQRGDRVRLPTRITIPRLLGLPGEFNYPRFLLFQDIKVTGKINSSNEIVLVRGGAEDSLQRRLDLIALALGNVVRKSVPDINVSSVLAALLVGDQKRIPIEIAEAYTRAGVNHILSISGFHIAIVAFFIVQLTLLLTIRSEILAINFNLRRLVLLISLPAMLFYLFITGAATATTRSVIMMIFMVVALYLERESDPINTLLVSALLLIGIHPPSLFDISFQLTFLSLWGIIIFVPVVMGLFKKVQAGWRRSLLQFLCTSCTASLVTAVPVLFIFDQASLNGIVSNFFIVPLMGYGAVLTGFCALPFVYLYEPVAHALLWLAGEFVIFSNHLIVLFAKLPQLKYYGVSHVDMAAFLGLMISATFIRNSRLKIAVCCLLPFMAIFAHASAPSSTDGRLHITMLSVGQAESLLIRLPDGGSMLVDGGGFLHENGKDFGERILAPALYKMDVTRIDRLILTHSHPDHIGGMLFLSRALPIGEFWEPAPGGVGEQYQRLRSNLREKNIPTKFLAAGDTLNLGSGVKISVLSPQRSHTSNLVDEKGMNDESLVFKLIYDHFSMLFMADAGFSAEERMVTNGADLRSTILKVGHHGSRFSTSSSFLDLVKPQAALVSSGFNNGFGLPAPDTLKLLDKKRIKTYRTDMDGTIELVTDGISWQVDTPFRP